jgi:hypothetical protein
MHLSTKRLWRVAMLATGKKNLSLTGLANLLGLKTVQTLKNWKVRGVSKAGLLTAHKTMRINPEWIAAGTGEAFTKSVQKTDAIFNSVSTIGLAIAEADELTREQARHLFDALTLSPNMANDIAGRLCRLLNHSSISAPTLHLLCVQQIVSS